ncbi:MAG: hypothetical protein HYV15_06705, partial [Elusimicrobia bacterium]|nr:hypothetical protein [Elusimicrobiota bacterium]
MALIITRNAAIWCRTLGKRVWALGLLRLGTQGFESRVPPRAPRARRLVPQTASGRFDGEVPEILPDAAGKNFRPASDGGIGMSVAHRILKIRMEAIKMRSASKMLMVLAVLGAFSTSARAADDGFVGAETCLGCHAQQQAFKETSHAKGMAAAKGVEFAKSCETCHGPGAKHAAAGGDKNDPGFATIVNPAKAKGDASCKACHAGDKGR